MKHILYAFTYKTLYLYKIDVKAYNHDSTGGFCKVNLTQEAFANRAGVALTVVRKIEQGKENLNLDKVNQVLKMFGHTLVPVSAKELANTNK